MLISNNAEIPKAKIIQRHQRQSELGEKKKKCMYKAEHAL